MRNTHEHKVPDQEYHILMSLDTSVSGLRNMRLGSTSSLAYENRSCIITDMTKELNDVRRMD